MTHHHHGDITHSHLATIDPSIADAMKATGFHTQDHSDLGEHDCSQYDKPTASELLEALKGLMEHINSGCKVETWKCSLVNKARAVIRRSR